LEKLTDKTFINVIKDASEVHQIIPRLIKEIHFNPDIPENHNVFLSNRNKNNKHLQVYRNGHWEIENKNTEIDNMINDKETNLSDWVAEKGQKYPKAKEKFDEYLDQKYDDETIRMMKDEVEQLLYNNRHMIKS
jgi:predicted glycosyltransferase involved in capsule biosynthesis